ncbi:MAG: hypothetical protein KUG79_19340 [Pseudomonadales bacterium]|nr:hypothetical protein [Pseudomonadales bacterium]
MHLESIDYDAVIDVLRNGFIAGLEDILEITLEAGETSTHSEKTYSPQGNCFVEVGFIGKVTGFVAICADEAVFSECFDLQAEASVLLDEIRHQITGPLKEIANTTAGKILKILLQTYSPMTMQAPKVTYGAVSYPKVGCVRHSMKTNSGEIHFYFSIDSMKLDVTKAIEKLEESEQKNQDVIEWLGTLFEELELTETNLVDDVGDTIRKIEEIERVLSDSEQTLDDTLRTDLQEALSTLTHTRQTMNRNLAITIHDLRVCNNQMLNHLMVTKVWEHDTYLKVTLFGYLEDRSNLAFFNEIGSGKLVINARNLLRFSDNGIRAWGKQTKRLSDKVDLSFEECTSHFLEVCLEKPRFADKLSVESILSLYTCASCHYREEVILHKDSHRQFQLPKVLCSCGNIMRLSPKQESTTEFLAQVNNMLVNEQTTTTQDQRH